jgi:hypothetical protein
MKLVTYLQQNKARLGIYHNGMIADMQAVDSNLPNNMRDFLFAGESAMQKALQIDADIKLGKLTPNKGPCSISNFMQRWVCFSSTRCCCAQKQRCAHDT